VLLRSLAFLLIYAVVCPAEKARKTDIEWVTNFDRALDLAQKTGKPMLLEFWASWCGPCKRMDQETWSDRRVVTVAQNYVSVSVDVDRDEAIKSRFVVHSLPTVILADPWANSLTRREGFVHAGDLAAMMAGVPTDFSPAREIHEALAEDPDNPTALTRMGQFYFRAKAPALAGRYYDQALRTPRCKSDVALRCELSLVIGLDYLLMRNWNSGRKLLTRFLAESPNGEHRDRALLGLIVADSKQQRLADARKSLAELREKFPGSEATRAAEDILERAK
jgi:thiol-disulfide isomerase/thioredoxin